MSESSMATTSDQSRQEERTKQLPASEISEDDSEVWPINRLSYEEIKPSELLVIDKLFTGREDSPLLTKWVMQRQPYAFHKRLLVISSYRIWLLKRKTVSFKSTLARCKQFPLLHLQHIQVLRATCAGSSSVPITTIKFLMGAAQHNHVDHSSTEVVHIDPGVHTEDIVRLLQRLLHSLRLAFPNKRLPTVHLPRNCHWRECFASLRQNEQDHSDQQQPEEGEDNKENQAETFVAMTTAYRAFCDYLGAPYRSSVTERLQECAKTLSSCVDFQYCLSFPPGVDGYETQHSSSSFKVINGIRASFLSSLSPSATEAIQLREVQALARTLEHVHCFEHIVIYDLHVGETGLSALFQSLLSPFSTIKGFALNNVRLSACALRTLQNVVLQSTIKREEHQRLQLKRLDFSFNSFSHQMANEMATTLELLPTGLDLLQLEQCELTSTSSSRILSALKTNLAFTSTLKELNLSGNCLGREGTRVLSSWITGAFALERLDLSQTQLHMNKFFQSFEQNTILHETSLIQLDLSYNQMHSHASYALGLILGKTKSLSTLFLRGMTRRFHPQTLVELSSKSRFFISTDRSSTLPFTRNGLRKAYLLNILQPMFQNNGRNSPCLVDLSENDLSGRKAELLAQLIDASPLAARASLRLDHTRLHDKASVLLLHSIRECKALDSLSLEGNGYVKRCVQLSRSRSMQPHHQDPTADCSSNLTTPGSTASPPSAIEVAAANALTLLLGHSSSSSSSPNVRSSALLPKPLRLKELCLKSESSYVFGTHVLTAAVAALTHNRFLQVLDVSGNACGDALAATFRVVLPINKALRVLFWDGNFTTVDGFAQFYDGLRQNETLQMLQMPIQDTRRILEEQKDPPREKLFSILGKIFKVTERNQTLLRKPAHHKDYKQQCHLQNEYQQASDTQSTINKSTEVTTGPLPQFIEEANEVKEESPELEELPYENKMKGKGDSKEPSPPTDALLSWDNADMHWSVGYPTPSSSSRYPSTMKSWNRLSGEDDSWRTQLMVANQQPPSFTASALT